MLSVKETDRPCKLCKHGFEAFINIIFCDILHLEKKKKKKKNMI